MRPRIREPHLPSFTLVMTCALDPSPVPSHCSSHFPRFPLYIEHPCQQHDSLMKTVDYRYVDDSSVTATTTRTVTEEETSVIHLEEAVTAKVTGTNHKRGRRLFVLIIDLASAVGRKLYDIKVGAKRDVDGTVDDRMEELLSQDKSLAKF